MGLNLDQEIDFRLPFTIVMIGFLCTLSIIDLFSYCQFKSFMHQTKQIQIKASYINLKAGTNAVP